MSQPIGPTLPTQSSTTSNPEIDSKIIGPSLPPHLFSKLHNQDETFSESDDENQNSEQTPASDVKAAIIGPALPPHLLRKTSLTDESSSDDECPDALNLSTQSYQPTVDSESKTSPDSSSYGPALPPHLQKVSTQGNSDDEDVYGPLPPGLATSSQAHQALEERALQIKLGQLESNEDKATVREEWMMELPDVQAKNLGLGARQFRKNPRPDFSDRSSWTDTPEAKAKKLKGKTEAKVDLKKEAELREIQKRDDEQRQMAEKHNKKKKRDKSLLEMHQDQLKKKKKEDEAEGPTRRPFSRDIDLQVNRFDEAQKKSILKKAMHLDDRFSKGQSKFL